MTSRVRGVGLVDKPSPPQLAAVVGVGVGVVVLTTVSPAWGVVGALLVAAAALLLTRPDAVTLLVIGLLYSNAVVIGVRMHGVPVVASALLPLALALPLLPRLLSDGAAALRLPKVLPLLLLLAALQAASAGLADEPRGAAADVIVFTAEGVVLFLLVTVALHTVELLRRTLWVVLLVGGALGALSVVQHVTGTYDNDYLGFAQISRAVVNRTAELSSFTNELGRTGIPRQSGPIGEQNRYAQVLLVLVPVGAAMVRLASGWPTRLLAVSATGSVLAGVALTYSRGAAVALVLVLVVALPLRLLPWRSVVAACLAIGVVLLTVPAYADRLSSLDAIAPARGAMVVDSGAADGAVQGRATENLAALQAVAEHPLLGVGPGAFPEVYRTYAERIGGRPRLEERQAHNLYFGLAAELGLLGLGCFLAVVGVVLRSLWVTRKRSADAVVQELSGALLLALLLYLASGAFLHLAYQRYFWLLLALAAAAAALPGTAVRRRAG